MTATNTRRKAGLPLRRKPQSRKGTKLTAAAPKPFRKPTRMPVGTACSGLWLVDCGDFGAFVGYIQNRNGREVTLLHARQAYCGLYRLAGLSAPYRLTPDDVGPAVPFLVLLDATALSPLAPGVTLPEPE